MVAGRILITILDTLMATWRLAWRGKQWGRDRFQESLTVVLIRKKLGLNWAEKCYRNLKLETCQ